MDTSVFAFNLNFLWSFSFLKFGMHNSNVRYLIYTFKSQQIYSILQTKWGHIMYKTKYEYQTENTDVNNVCNFILITIYNKIMISE